MGTLVSQSFTNDAADEAGKFYSDGRVVENGHANIASTFTVSYNATNKSYTVSTTGRTQTFAEADKVASGSSDFIAYQKSSGSLKESLSLTVPGASGALQYQYVGGGAWERANIGSTTMDFTYNPFTYGIVTPNANLARTGTGLFSVSLVGARMSELPYALAGSGNLQIDFGSGSLVSSGVLTTIDVSTGYILGLGIYFGSAQLSSTSNDFAGSFAMDDGTRFTGSWKGRFYGPANQEVGAVWTLSAATGEYAAGWLIGRQDSSVAGYNTTLDTLKFSETFAARFSEVSFHDNGDGSVPLGATVQRNDATMAYDAAAQSFRFVDSLAGIDTLFPSSSLNAGASNSKLAVYDIVGGGTPYRLSLFKAGAGNPQYALTYVSYGNWRQAQVGATDARDRWFVWGARTNAFQIPTGTGHYDGILAGTAVSKHGGPIYTLGGTSSFDIDFGAGTFTGALNPTGTNVQSGASRNFGTFTFSSGLMDIDGGLAANVLGAGGKYLGFFEGALYGPQAQELGGTFGFASDSLNSWDPGYSDIVQISGVTVAKKTP